MSDGLSNFSILAIRSGESPDDPLYPIPGELTNTVELTPEDGEPVDLTQATTLSVFVTRKTQGPRRLIRIERIKADIIITQARVAVACSKYEKGGGWRGLGAGALIAVAANAGSMALAAHRRRGKMLVGHVPYSRLVGVGYKPPKSRKYLEILRLYASYPLDNGFYRGLLLDFALRKNDPRGQYLAQQIVRWAAYYRLTHEAGELDTPNRDLMDKLCEAEPLAPSDDGSMRMYYLRVLESEASKAS